MDTKHAAIPRTTIMAAIIGSAVGLIIILGLLLLLLRRRARRRKQAAVLQSPLTPDLPIQRPGMMEAGFGRVADRSENVEPIIASARALEFPRRPRTSSGLSTSSTAPILGNGHVPKMLMPKRPPPSVARFTPGQKIDMMVRDVLPLYGDV